MKKVIEIGAVAIVLIAGGVLAEETNSVENVISETNLVEVVAAETNVVEAVANSEPTVLLKLGGTIPLSAKTMEIASVAYSPEVIDETTGSTNAALWSVSADITIRRRQTLTVNGNDLAIRYLVANLTTEYTEAEMQTLLGDNYEWVLTATQAGAFAPSGTIQSTLIQAVAGKVLEQN